MKRGRVRLWPLVIAFSLFAGHGAAHAELVSPSPPAPAARDEAGAQAAYDKASKLAQRRQFAAAFPLARESLERAPSAQRAALVGAIDIELGRSREALEALIIAVDLDTELKLQDYVAKRLASLPPFQPADLGIVRFQLTPSAATCTLDATAERFDVDPTRTAVGLPAGRQTITCSAPGHRDGRIDIAVLGRKVVTTSLQLLPEPGASEPIEGSHQTLRRGPDRTLPIALLIGGGVAVAAGVAFHVWALDAKSAGDAALERAPLDYDAARADYRAAQSDLALRRGLTIGAYALGGVLVGTGLVLFFTGGDEPAAVTLLPRVGPDHVGATCALRF